MPDAILNAPPAAPISHGLGFGDCSARLGDEPGRLAALGRYGVLDTLPEPEFDSITALLKSIFATPFVVISLVDTDRQWFKSRQGTFPAETPRDVAFCHYTIAGRGVMAVNDASRDARFEDNPLVTGAPHIRAYLGAPLRTPDGYNVGSICVIDTVPRRFSEADADLLAKFADVVVSQLELRQIASRDTLTGALTRRNLEAEASRELARLQRYGGETALILFDLDHFKAVNDTYGHPAGDSALKATVQACHDVLRENDCLGRFGGEEFAVLAPCTSARGALALAERMRAAIAAISLPDHPMIALTASFGVAVATAETAQLADWIGEADRRLYEAKRGGRNRSVAGIGS